MEAGSASEYSQGRIRQGAAFFVLPLPSHHALPITSPGLGAYALLM